MTLDKLELELRRLPGVRSVGFETTDEFLLVQVHVTDHTKTSTSAAFETARIARRHSILPVSVEIVRWQGSSPTAHAAAPPPVAAEPVLQHDGFSEVETVPEAEVVVAETHAGRISTTTEFTPPNFDTSEPILENEARDEYVPPRISPITAVINSFATPVREQPIDEAAEISNPAEQALEAEPAASWDPVSAPVVSARPMDEIREQPLAEPIDPSAVATNAHSSSSPTEPSTQDFGDLLIDLTKIAGSEERVQLLAVLPFPDDDAVEVHLVLDGQRSVGRSPASHGLSGAAAATVQALEGFSDALGFEVKFAHRLPEGIDTFLVVVCVEERDSAGVTVSRYGVAASGSPSEAAARATLHALNRRLYSASSTA